MTKYAAALFDIDGTIVPIDAVVKAIQQTYREMGVKMPTPQEVKDYIIGRTFQEVLKSDYGMKPDEISRARGIYLKYYESIHKTYSPLFENVKPLFARLAEQKIKVGIITTKQRREADVVLRDYGLNPDALVSADDVTSRKPSPEPVLKAMKMLWVQPRACIFTGDHIYDVQAAKAAGCTAVGVTTGCDSRDELLRAGADYVIADLSELVGIIE